MTTAIESNVSASAAKTYNDFASKEYVQKEHKETTRLIVALSICMVAAILLTSALMTFGFNHSVGTKLDAMQTDSKAMQTDMKADMKYLISRMENIEKTNNAIAANVARLDGYVQGKTLKAP